MLCDSWVQQVNLMKMAVQMCQYTVRKRLRVTCEWDCGTPRANLWNLEWDIKTGRDQQNQTIQTMVKARFLGSVANF